MSGRWVPAPVASVAARRPICKLSRCATVWCGFGGGGSAVSVVRAGAGWFGVAAC